MPPSEPCSSWESPLGAVLGLAVADRTPDLPITLVLVNPGEGGEGKGARMNP